MAPTLTNTKPDWYAEAAPERQGLWSAGDHRRHLLVQAAYGERVRLVLKDGSVFDGTMGEHRDFWNPAKFAVALRIPGRKSQKWFPVRDIAVAWGDKGRPLVEMLADLIENH